PWVATYQRRRLNEAKIDADLKRDMLDRGMSADEIEQVISAGRVIPARGVELPMACEAVVESDGEWHAALVLKRDGDRWYIHYVGSSMEENEWVKVDRMRFPAGAMNHHELTAGMACDANGSAPKKAAGVGLDL
ncbi:MAG TPA: hypothetical protein VGY53_13110, partial [Isosphaeraceae bacterium]|nr:hypothetical protein [Isosphaeraceae bacterium]